MSDNIQTNFPPPALYGVNLPENHLSPVVSTNKQYKILRYNIHLIHNNLLAEVNFHNISIWKDSKNNLFYYSNETDEIKTNKTELGDYLSGVMNKPIEIFDSAKDIPNMQVSYLLISLLPIVTKRIFNPNLGFGMNILLPSNNTFHWNSFIKTTYLLNKYNHIYPLLESSLIEYFILNLCENKEQSKWIINWIASFFQTSHKSNTALVLIGDKETTDVLINQIIKPIFIARKEYFCVIDDEMLEKSSEDKILKNRIFYHIDELSDKNINSKKTSNIVRKILSQNRLDILESEVYGDIYIHGELLVTSNDKTPYPFLKDSYRSCEVFNVKSLSSILKNLNMDRITFDTNIQNDLNNFSNHLAQKVTDMQYLNKYSPYNFDEKNALLTMKKGLLLTPLLESKIEDFINAIIGKNLNYFNAIKDEVAIYEEFEYNFNEGMIAQPLLSQYFNLVQREIIFSDNGYFIDILKEKK